ncbi:hypothetical protein V1264_008532 [Littorina saxatilis]|uniref:Uncharacterized protein n=1 Tax=Littorina saxatilis TaxID=31220 RepID=A0AAN9ATA0_9CAEN
MIGLLCGRSQVQIPAAPGGLRVEIFPISQVNLSADLLVPYYPLRVYTRASTRPCKCAWKRSCNPCQSLVGYRNTKIPSIMLLSKVAYGCLNGGVKTVIRVKTHSSKRHE